MRWTRRRNDASTRMSSDAHPRRDDLAVLDPVRGRRACASRAGRRSGAAGGTAGRGRSSTPSRLPDPPERRGRRAAPDLRERRLEQRRAGGRRAARPPPSRRAVPSSSWCPSAAPPPRLLGRDQVAVVRLAAVEHLDLGAGAQLVDPPRERLGAGEVAAVAVVDRDELEPGRERLDRVEDGRRPGRRGPRRARRRGRARSSGPASPSCPLDRRVADRLGHRQRLDRRGRRRSSPSRSSAASLSGSSARSAAKPSAALRVATTATGRSDIDVTWRAARTTFGLFGQEQDLARVDGLDRLEQLAGARVRGLAAVHDLLDAEVAEDRGEALARGDGHDRERRRIRARERRRCRRAARGRCPSAAGAAPRRDRRCARLARERRRARLAHVARSAGRGSRS